MGVEWGWAGLAAMLPGLHFQDLPLPPGVGVTQGRLTPQSPLLMQSKEDNNSK